MTDTLPTVAVIIPTYNRADMVSAAIESLLIQTRPPAQIIVVDDGSTDNTQAVLAQYRAKITTITQVNYGRSVARNAGIERVISDYVAFLDSDDTLPPNSIALRAEVLDASPGVDVVYGDAWLEDSASTQRVRYFDLHRGMHPSGYVFPSLAQDVLAPIHCFMARKSCFQRSGRFDEGLDTLEDHDLWLRISRHSRFDYVDAPVATYIIHPAMTTRAMPDRMRYGRLVVQKRAVSMPEFEMLTPNQKASVFASIGATSLALGDMKGARFWLRRSNEAIPSLNTSVLYALSFLGVTGTRPILAMRRKLRALLHPETRMFYG